MKKKKIISALFLATMISSTVIASKGSFAENEVVVGANNNQDLEKSRKSTLEEVTKAVQEKLAEIEKSSLSNDEKAKQKEIVKNYEKQYTDLINNEQNVRELEDLKNSALGAIGSVKTGYVENKDKEKEPEIKKEEDKKEEKEPEIKKEEDKKEEREPEIKKEEDRKEEKEPEIKKEKDKKVNEDKKSEKMGKETKDNEKIASDNMTDENEKNTKDLEFKKSDEKQNLPKTSLSSGVLGFGITAAISALGLFVSGKKKK